MSALDCGETSNYLSNCYSIAWDRLQNHLRLSVILSVCQSVSL